MALPPAESRQVVGLTPVFRHRFQVEKALVQDSGCSLRALLETRKDQGFFFPSLPIFPSFFPNSCPLPLLPPARRPAQLGPVRAVPGVREAGMSWLSHGRNGTYAPPRRPSSLRLHSNPRDTRSGPSQLPGQPRRHLVLGAPSKSWRVASILDVRERLS